MPPLASASGTSDLAKVNLIGMANSNRGRWRLGVDYYFGVPVVNSPPPFVWVENHRVLGLVKDDPFVFRMKAKKREFSEKMGLTQIGGADAAHALYDDEAVGTKLCKEGCRLVQGPEGFTVLSLSRHHSDSSSVHSRTTLQGNEPMRTLWCFIHELDWMVGEIMKTLEEQGVTDNTLVIFTSDNGGMFNVGGQNAWDKRHHMNGKLLGYKFSAWEGGHRVPFIARWSGKIQAGSTSDQLVSKIDLFATMAAITGSKVRTGQGQVSVNILPTLTATPTKRLRSHIVLSPFKPTHLSIRKGKLMFIGAQAGGGFTAAKRGAHAIGGLAAITYAGRANSDIANGRIKKDAPPAQLYDFENDMAQTTNLYRKHLEVVRELKALLAKYPAPKTAPAKRKRRNQ